MKPSFPQLRAFPIIVLVLAVLIYAGSLRNDFVFDDFREVVDNPLVGSFSFPEFLRLYFRGSGQLSAPPARVFPLLSYVANHALHGLRPFGYHLVNVLLHGLVSLLVYRTTLLLFPARPRLAFLTAALFALHPVHGDVVNPVAGRSELISSLIYFWIIRLYLKNTADPLRTTRGWWYWTSLPLFLVGALSKEVSWSLPLVLAGIDFYRFRQSSRGGLAAYWPVFRRRLGAYYLPFLLVPVLIIAIVIAAGYAPGAGENWANYLRYLPPLQRSAAALGILARYLVLLSLPFRLSCDYGYAQLSSPAAAVRFLWTAGGVLAAAGGVLLARASLKRTGRYFLAVWIFAAPYLIVSNLLLVINTPMAERLLYLPSWGFCLLAGLLLEDLRARAARGGRAVRILVRLLPAALLVSCGLRTLARNRDWRDQTALMESAARVCPMSGRVHFNLARSYELENRLQEALVHYQTASAILPLNPVMRLNLGNILVRFGRREEAAACYREASRLDPLDPRAYSNLGRLSGEMGDWDEAAAAHRRAAELAPADPVVRNSLGIALYRAGDREGAVRAFREALALDPGFADPRRNLELIRAAGEGR